MEIFQKLPEVGDMPVALTIGNFDGVHLGHQAMITRLKQAARQRNLPACVLTFEPHPREFIHPLHPPQRLTNVGQKADLLESIGVDRLYVCKFDEHMATMSAEQFVSRVLVEQLVVQWLLVGDDFKFGAQRSGDFPLLKNLERTHGFVVEAMPTVSDAGERVSSSSVRSARENGNLARMFELLGRHTLC